MKIEDFNHSHIDMAVAIAMENYEEERKHVPILPKMDKIPEISHFADNQLGVVAEEEGRLIGFLGAFSPREDAFGTTNVLGTFSPIHGHGVIGTDKDRIYSRLYQAAADKWVKAGILSHAVAFYTHDKEALKSFYYNGFGLRCIDAIRIMEELPAADLKVEGYGDKETLAYLEVEREDWSSLLDFHNQLIYHLGSSPSFMKFPKINNDQLYHRTSETTRYFAVKDGEQLIAYIKVESEGENFITLNPGMLNICGAYCLPQYRGRGIYQKLLSYMISILKKEGYSLLGVDCESFNPTARGFWLKYFTEYTHSVVRRIDDKAIQIFN